MTVGDVLLKAASLVEQGWCQRKTRLLRGGRVIARCALGAIAEAGKTGLIGAAVVVVEKEVGDDLDAWNDAPGRTKEEVADALRQAALRSVPPCLRSRA